MKAGSGLFFSDVIMAKIAKALGVSIEDLLK